MLYFYHYCYYFGANSRSFLSLLSFFPWLDKYDRILRRREGEGEGGKVTEWVKERLHAAVGAKLNAGIELEYTRVPYCTSTYHNVVILTLQPCGGIREA